MKDVFIALVMYALMVAFRWYQYRKDPEQHMGNEASIIQWATSGEIPCMLYCGCYLALGSFNYWTSGMAGPLAWALIFAHETVVGVGYRRLLDEREEPCAYYDKTEYHTP